MQPDWIHHLWCWTDVRCLWCWVCIVLRKSNSVRSGRVPPLALSTLRTVVYRNAGTLKKWHFLSVFPVYNTVILYNTFIFIHLSYLNNCSTYPRVFKFGLQLLETFMSQVMSSVFIFSTQVDLKKEIISNFISNLRRSCYLLWDLDCLLWVAVLWPTFIMQPWADRHILISSSR